MPGRAGRAGLLFTLLEITTELPSIGSFGGSFFKWSNSGDPARPGMDSLTDQLIEDIEQNPNGENLFRRLDRLTAGTMTSAMSSCRT